MMMPLDGPLRVIQVVNVRWFNATAWYGLFLASLLREAGHEVRVLCLPDTEPFDWACAAGLAPAALRLNSTNPLAVAMSYGALRRLTQEFRPHIVNCHRGESFVLWGLLRQRSDFGLVRTRGDQRPPKGNLVNRILHATVADAVIATSSGIATTMREKLGVPPDRLHTIFGGVDTRRFYPDAQARAAMRTQLGINPEETAVGLVGRFDTVKGQKELIAAFARFRASLGEGRPLPRLVLAGATASTSEEQVVSWARAAGLADAVLFPGRCEDVRALMNALDLGVVASLGSETIARVALEIMACGTPLVGTCVGVMPDLLDDNALVPPGDTEALAGILRRFVTDPHFRRTLREAQQARMRTLRDTDFLKQTLAVYREVVRRRFAG